MNLPMRCRHSERQVLMFEAKRVYDHTDDFGTRVVANLFLSDEGVVINATRTDSDLVMQVLLNVDELAAIAKAVEECRSASGR